MRRAKRDPGRRSPCDFLRLVNAREALWEGAEPVFEAVPDAESLRGGGRPLLFVHGIEYASPRQVFTDLIAPFEKEAQFLRRRPSSPWQVYVVAWDSRIAISEALRRKVAESLVTSLWHFAVRAPFFPRHLKSLEGKARRIAHHVRPFVRRMLATADESPLVVSHSLGSYLWAELVAGMVRNGWHDMPWGTWLNMQPAICHRAYAPGGSLHPVLEAYDGVRGTQHLWYSSQDLVLATLYRLGKKSSAMGQVGAGDAPLIQRDLTRMVREAHGLTKLRRTSGHFFQRVGSVLHMEAELITGDHSVAFYY